MEENLFVSFYFDAFIPQAVTENPFNPGGVNPFTDIDLFEGDDRGFEYGGSYRARQAFVVDLLDENPQAIPFLENGINDTSETIGLDSDGNEVARDKASTEGFLVDVEREGESIKIEADVGVGNPLVTSPNIDYDFDLSVSVSGEQLNYELTGNHDGFPAYSVYVGEELIYGHDPVATNQTALSLFFPKEFSVNESGVIDLADVSITEMSSDQLDVIFLQDLSSSFEDNLPVLQSLASPLVDTLLEENSDTFFGVASFIDQPLEPFGAPGDFVYQTNLPITDSESSVIATINSLSTGNGGDDPEAQLTALLETATRTEELGYRDNSARYVFLSTDASFQQGDGYPSIAQVKTALENNNVVPIFLVTSDVTGVYQGLASSLGRGEVVTLTNNSSNVTDAVRLAFAEIEGEVTSLGTDGDDDLTGDATDEGIFGGLGDDTIDGLGGDDILDGGAGNDELNGSAGDDELNGGTGEDIIDGGSGSDLIEGGLDADVLTGSAAADTFAGTLDELDGDVITDFTEDDRILVRDADFTEENLTVTEGSAILDIDVDSDETIDSTITLEGDFTDSSFVVESESFEDVTNTIITIGELEPPSQTIEDVIDLSNSDNQSVTFTVSRSAAFENTVDFYEINADGSVTDSDGSTIALGETGYQEAAIAQRLGLDLTSPNGQSTEYSVELEGGNIYVPLLVANGEFSELTDEDTSNVPNVFFPYAEANIDNFDHIRSQGNLTFEFEDLLNGGTNPDFDDITVEVSGLDLDSGIGEVTTESVFGTPDDDLIEVTGSSQQIEALAGNDTIDASVGNGGNRIEAGSGDDTVILGTSDHGSASFADRVVGGEGDDSFFASRSGSNVITGGAGADEFWIVDTVIPESVNIITDFTGGEDIVGITGLGISFEELSISQTGDNTLIGTNEKDLVILQNVEAASLGNADFAFT